MLLFGHGAGCRSNPGLCGAQRLICWEEPATGFVALLAGRHRGSGEAEESGRPPSTTQTLLPGGPLPQGHLEGVQWCVTPRRGSPTLVPKGAGDTGG